MSSPDRDDDLPAPALAAAGQRLHGAAFVVLLASVAARCFLSELPYDNSALQFLPDDRGILATQPVNNPMAYRADRSELSRMTFAVLLLAAGALWAVGGAVAGKLTVRQAPLAGLIGAFAVLSLASALRASNARAALDGWIEQVSLLAAGLLAVQLCADRRRFALLVVVLAAVGAALAAKGYWQRTTEIPDRVADFDANRVQHLRNFGWEPNTPQAELIEARMRDPAVTGYFALANPFGSLLLVAGFAAVGLAADKFRSAVRSWREQKDTLKKGEIDPPAVAAGLAVLAAGAVALAVVLTHSRGAAVAGVAGGLALLAVLRWREGMARQWRRGVLGVAAAGVLAAGGLIAYGLSTDRLPTRTMTFRWHYWTATAGIVAENPVLGVGPGNFASAYLHHRRDEAEEEIQMPHNAVAHALAAYGLPGGACYLAILGWLLVGCARPRADEPPPEDEPPRREARAVLVALPLTVLVARVLFWNQPEAAFLVVLDLFGPPIVLAVCLAAMGWSGRGLWRGAEGFAGAARPAVACGAAAFVLHNLVTYSLWMPATAGVFHVAAGACLARAGGRPRTVTEGCWVVALAAGAAVVVGAALFWLPVMRKTHHTAEMLAALRRANVPAAFRHAQLAVRGDGLDPRPAADALEVAMMHLALPGTDIPRVSRRAMWLADRAIALDPRATTYRRLAANLAWAGVQVNNPQFARALAKADAAHRAGRSAEAARLWREAARTMPVTDLTERAVRRMREAVERDPKDARLRIHYAEVLCNTAQHVECLRELEEALRLDAALPAESVKRLRGDDHAEIAMLRLRVRLLRAPASRPAATAPTTATAPAVSGPRPSPPASTP